MFGLGPTELAIILVIVLVLFGVGKLSQVGGALGKSIREFREASEGTVMSDTVAASEPVVVSRGKSARSS